LAAVLDISSAVILFYGTEDQKSAYADFKQLRKTGINPFLLPSTSIVSLDKTWRPRLSRDWIRPISNWNIVIGPVGTTLSNLRLWFGPSREHAFAMNLRPDVKVMDFDIRCSNM